MHEVVLPKTLSEKKSVLMCPQEPCKIIVTLILQRIVHLVCAKDLEFEAVFSGIALFFSTSCCQLTRL